jgi:hypothetical protein
MRARIAVSVVAVACAVGLAAFGSGAGAAPARAGHTVQIVVRPVTSTGHAVSGFHVAPEPTGQLDCSGAGASPGAVSKNILECSPSAEYAIACWKSATPKRALCMRNPRNHKLAKIPYTGSFAHTAPPRTNGAPLAITLGDGDKCSIRDGGAWSTLKAHPKWNGEYSCVNDGVVWAPPSSHHYGLNESHAQWTVHTGAASGDGPVVVRNVSRAYFVGTQHA